jgi:hypothetical protein
MLGWENKIYLGKYQNKMITIRKYGNIIGDCLAQDDEIFPIPGSIDGQMKKGKYRP